MILQVGAPVLVQVLGVGTAFLLVLTIYRVLFDRNSRHSSVVSVGGVGRSQYRENRGRLASLKIVIESRQADDCSVIQPPSPSADPTSVEPAPRSRTCRC